MKLTIQNLEKIIGRTVYEHYWLISAVEECEDSYRFTLHNHKAGDIALRLGRHPFFDGSYRFVDGHALARPEFNIHPEDITTPEGMIKQINKIFV